MPLSEQRCLPDRTVRECHLTRLRLWSALPKLGAPFSRFAKKWTDLNGIKLVRIRHINQ